MHTKHSDKVQFLMVYIREAHASDEWSIGSNTRAGIVVAQPKTDEQRTAVAQQFVKQFQPNFPVVVDSTDDIANKLYGGWPDRLYVIDAQGKIAYQGKRGPFGFSPRKAETTIQNLITTGSN